MTDNTPPFVLVDGSYYLFRTYHALPPLRNRDGLHTNAVRGTVNALNKLMRTYQPTHMAVLFDTKEPTFRHELSVEYKAHRPPMDSELSEQIPYIHAVIQALGIPLIIQPGAEADDLIGTLATQAQSMGHEVLISTGDKDMAQLVNERVVLEDSFKGSRMDVQGVIDKFGIRPDQMIDYLTLMGDASDGIKGIPGIGQKTAAKLLQEYENIGGILENVEKIKGRAGKNLVEYADTIPLNHQLASIVTDLPLNLAYEDLKIQDYQVDKLRELYTELEFKNDLQSLNHPNNPNNKNSSLNNNPVHQNQNEQIDQGHIDHENALIKKYQQGDVNYQTICAEEDFTALLEKLESAEQFVFDTETTSLDWRQAEIVGLSFALPAQNHAHDACYIPLTHVNDSGERHAEQLDRDMVLGKLKPIFENANIGKIGQHMKYDAHVLANHGIALKGWAFDTMLASYVLNAAATRHGMDDLATYYLNYTTTSFEQIAGKGAKQLRFDQIAIDTASNYACEDADITYRLYDVFSKKMAADSTLTELLLNVELPSAEVLTEMEANGILLDHEVLNTLSEQFQSEIDTLEQQAHELAGKAFNVASPKQLGTVLFEDLGLKGGKKTKSGQYSTSEAVLSKIDHPLVAAILEYRSLAKLKNTYTEALVKQADTSTKRVHTSYHQAITSTGRLSSTDPNLQNIPIRTENGRLIRKAFVAPTGKVLLAADYSQIELRLMAHFSEDDNLLYAFNQGLDIHAATAAEVMQKAVADVTSEERRQAKAVNFGLLYGMSAFGLAKQLGIGRGEAQDYIDQYFTRYPSVLEYMHNTRMSAHEQGYVQTILGRKLYTPDVKSQNRMVKNAAERAAINAPLQGSAAEIIKLAMVAVHQKLAANTEHDHANMLLQVHDELVFEVAASKADDTAQLIKTTMQNVLPLKVPLVVEVGKGDNWDAAH